MTNTNAKPKQWQFDGTSEQMKRVINFLKCSTSRVIFCHVIAKQIQLPFQIQSYG